MFVLYLHLKRLCLSFNFPFWQAKRHLCCFAAKLQYVLNTVSAGALVVTLDHCHALAQTKHIVSKRTVVCFFVVVVCFCGEKLNQNWNEPCYELY